MRAVTVTVAVALAVLALSAASADAFNYKKDARVKKKASKRNAKDLKKSGLMDVKAFQKQFQIVQFETPQIAALYPTLECGNGTFVLQKGFTNYVPVCQCLPGYIRENEACVEDIAQGTDECRHGVVVKTQYAAYGFADKCVCYFGWAGPTCETSLGPFPVQASDLDCADPEQAGFQCNEILAFLTKYPAGSIYSKSSLKGKGGRKRKGKRGNRKARRKAKRDNKLAKKEAKKGGNKAKATKAKKTKQPKTTKAKKTKQPKTTKAKKAKKTRKPKTTKAKKTRKPKTTTKKIAS